MWSLDADGRAKNEIGNVRISERSVEEARSLSPIEEESESTQFSREVLSNLTNSEPDESGCDNLATSPCNERRRMPRIMEGDSSSGDERPRSNRQLRRVEGSYCCFKPETEASGDNDEAEIGLRDKVALRTTVEQLKRRLSQAEREIAALKRYRSPQRCRGHERCETLRGDLQTWRDDYEKRINSRIVDWQSTERRRLHDEMGNVSKVYDTIQQHLQALERQNARSYLDFRQQIDGWEKRFKEDVVRLHDGDLTDLREQLKAWCEMQNATNLSRVREERCEARETRDNDTAKLPDGSSKSEVAEVPIPAEDNAKLLRRMERVIKLEVQQHRDELVKRLDRKVARLWSAFENFQHNFHLDRDYRRYDRDTDDDDDADSIKAGDLGDVTCRETARRDSNREPRSTSPE